MSGWRRNIGAVLAMGLCTLWWAAQAAPADGLATGYAEITSIQYGLVDPGGGTIAWLYAGPGGGPAWQGEAWAEARDSLGGTDADYDITPDGSGRIGASAGTTLVWSYAEVNLVTEQLYGESESTQPPGQWSSGAELGGMFDYFNLSPTTGSRTGPIEMAFSFDYSIRLTGQAEPGAPYYSDALVRMRLEYQDALGDWQPVPGGQLARTEAIGGSGTESDDVTFDGQLSTTVLLAPYVWHSLQFEVYLNETPEPSTLVLLTAGGLALATRRRWRREQASYR